MSKRRSLIGLMAAIAAALGFALTIGPAQASTHTEINILGSTHCLDNATEIAAKLQMWSCTGGPEQQWTQLYNNATDTAMLINENTGWCVTAPASGFGSLVMQPCDTSLATQQWTIAPQDTPSAFFFWLENGASGTERCISSSSVANGTVPYMFTCDPTQTREKWILFA
jgi:Ricin-type beta-trefoil lectin domain